MLRIRYWIKDFFGFPRSQVNGFLVLLTLLILLIFSEPAWHWWVAHRDRDISADKVILDSLISLWDTRKEKDTLKAPLPELFYFDPNKSTEDQFVALGFSTKIATRIMRYREKGGKFRAKSDVLRIYGVDTALYERIYPFITLPEVAKKPWKTEKKFEARETAKPKERPAIFDLNKADTSMLKAISGIGEKLSVRILKYRDILGGFVSTEQLKDVYGLDSVVIKRLVEASYIDDGFIPRKMDINNATEKELSAHPYINKAARIIVSYRFQHGDFKKVEDIRTVLSLDEKNFQKMAVYLEVQ
jgi:DNA uptake protein ComE-like DNA-binding protein